MRKSLLVALLLCGTPAAAYADDDRERGCSLPSSLINTLRTTLVQAEGMTPQGIFAPKAM